MAAQLDYVDFRDKLRAEKPHCRYDDLVLKYGVNRWYLWQIVHDDAGTFNLPPKIATRLGIRVYLPAPACPRCGKVHVSKRCTAQPRRYRDLFDMPATELLRRLENRYEL